MALKPKISIVIPSRNEEKYIGKCIDSILNSDFDLALIELMICDGMSDDGTREIVSRYHEKYPQVLLLDNHHRTTPFGLNLGIKKSSAEYIMILGAHAELASDYLKKCMQVFSDNKEAACVGGVLENIAEDETTAAIALAMSSPFGVGSAHFRTGLSKGFVDTVAFGMYKQEVFTECGYFDEDLTRNQDDEFNYRILKKGYKIWLQPDLHIIYYVRSSFVKLARQYLQYGYWKVYVNKKHKAITTSRQLVPAVFTLYLLTGWIPVFLITWWLVLYALGIIVYTSFSFYSASVLTKDFTEKLMVVRSFWILHLTYGWGYLQGIWDFIIMNRKPNQKKSSLSR